MEFISNKDQVIISTVGRSIEFKKGEPTYVPKMMWPAVLAVGIIPADEMPDDTEKKEPVLTDEERKAKLSEAIAVLADENAREKFTGNGMPRTEAISDLSGVYIDAKERDALWTEYLQSKVSDDK